MTREIGIEVKSSLNTPSEREMRADIEKLKVHCEMCVVAIRNFEQQIEGQKAERAHFKALSKNPIEDGVRYNAEACARAAKKSDKNIGMFNALIKKESEKISQIEYMISEIERQMCLSAQMLQ